MSTIKKKLVLLVLLFVSCAGFAQGLKVSAPNVVSSDETFRIVFSANGKISDFKWAGSDDFSVVWGPQTGSVKNISVINGKKESVYTESYTYLLQPKKEGTFTIEAATAKVDNKFFTSGAFTIEVVKGDVSSGSANSGQNSSEDERAATSGTLSGDDIFLKLSVNKFNVVKGEPVVAVLKLYTRADISGFENVKFPTFNGFWSKEIETPQNIEFIRENVNGKIYSSAVLRKYMLIPQQAGVISIDPAELVCQIRIKTSGGGASSIFSDFFDSYQTIRKRIISPSLKINVKSLPSGAPASFAGGVGDFKVSAQMSKDSINANEAVSLLVTVTGSGNISMLEAPKVDFPSDFEVYDIKSTDKISADGTKGSKTFEYPFIPRAYGDFKIGPVEYSYYDIAKGKYISSFSDKIELKVGMGSEVEQGGVIMPGVVRQSVKNLGEDIRFIFTGEPRLRSRGSFFMGSVLFFVLMALIIMLYFVAAKVLSVMAERRVDIIGSKNRRANKVACMRLKAAGDYLKNNLGSAFYEEMHKAITGYVSDKLMIPLADLSKDRISDKLKSKGVADDLINSLLGIIDACEFARYAPQSVSVEMENHYKEAIKIISEMEAKVKNKNNIKNSLKTIVVTVALSVAMPAFSSAQTLSLPSQSALNDTIKNVAANNASVSDTIMVNSNKDVSELWDMGNKSFTEGDYKAALAYYRAIESKNHISAVLYYNIGNSYFKTGNIGFSVLYYEKALKINPGYGDAKNNLAIANGSVLDKIEKVPDFILFTWIQDIKYLLSSDVWGWITVFLAAVIALFMLGFKFSGSHRRRKISFILACITLFFTVVTLLFSISARLDALSDNKAIVISHSSSVKSSPGETGKSLFILHEGTKVQLLDNLGKWKQVEIADGRQGWILARDIKEI